MLNLANRWQNFQSESLRNGEEGRVIHQHSGELVKKVTGPKEMRSFCQAKKKRHISDHKMIGTRATIEALTLCA